jgi:penicillin-binding protein-related factor A (putative recombinase)
MGRKESFFNTVFKNSIIEIEKNPCSAYKISDIGGEATIQKPFDGFGVFQNKSMYWEAKRVNGVSAFNIKNLFEGERGHQMLYMDMFSKIPDTYTWVVLFCYIPRKSIMYVFEYDTIKRLYEEGVTSIKKKNLLCLPFSEIKKEKFDYFEIIDYNLWKAKGF